MSVFKRAWKMAFDPWDADELNLFGKITFGCACLVAYPICLLDVLSRKADTDEVDNQPPTSP